MKNGIIILPDNHIGMKKYKKEPYAIDLIIRILRSNSIINACWIYITMTAQEPLEF